MKSAELFEFFSASRSSLLRYLTLQGATVDEAEDILQEVGLKLASESIGPVDQPKAYLYRMAHNHLLLRRRTNMRRLRREENWVEAHSGYPPDLDETPSAETRLIASQQLAFLQAVIDRLPERTRSIFRRFRLDGISQRSIADEFGISISAVEKHLARAYAAIAKEKERFSEVHAAPRSLQIQGGQRHES